MTQGQSSQFMERISALLETLSAHEEMNATDLAEVLGEPRSSVYRLLKNLADVGWVDEGADKGTWRLGLQLFRLSSNAVQRLDERKAARPHMENLHTVTEQTVFLCVKRDWQAICIDRIEGLRVANLALRLGGSLPLHLGAAPLALLAFSDDATRASWVTWARETALEQPLHSPLTVESVLAEIEIIRTDGYVVSDGDITAGIAAVGAPIFDYAGTVRGSVSVSGLRDQILDPEGTVIAETLKSADAISRSLGYREALQ
jgi:DNA-binding IclR family transcriptional regulator